MTESTSLDIKFTQRFSSNLISNIIYFVLNVIIGIVLAPFFLDTLGQGAYGLIPLATSISSYVTLLINSVNGSVSRFLTIDLQKGDMNSANKTFNTALFGTLAIVLILTPIALVIACFAPQIFKIGDIASIDVTLLFALVFISVLIRTWSSNFMVTLFAHNRLDLRNIVEITNLIVQIGLIITLFTVFGPSLVYVGFAYLCAAIASITIAYIMSHRICPYLSIQPNDFIWEKFKEIGNVAIWMGFNTLGCLLWTHISLTIVNIFFGEISGTEYSLCLTWIALITSISGLITNTFTPKIYSYYTTNDKVGLLNFTKTAIKITGLFMALPIALVYLFVPELMTLWVGAEYASLWSLIWILFIPMVMQIQVPCIYPINSAYKKVVIPAIANFCGGSLNLILALTLPQILDIGMYAVAIAYVIPSIILYGVVSPFYNAYVIKAPRFSYFKYMVLCVFIMWCIVLAGSIYRHFVNIDSLISLILSIVIVSVTYMLILLKLLLGKDDRKWIRVCIPSFISKLIPKWLL